MIARNFHSRFGEIDIVASKEDCLVFVEVKARWSAEFGLPEEAVGKRKLSSIIKTAEYFRALHPGLPESERIDVVAMEFAAENKVKRVEILENVSEF